MIPQQGTSIGSIEQVSMPSLTYRIDPVSKRIVGMIDEKEALLQAVEKLLNTERYAYVIYDSQYGVELERLIGKPVDFVMADLPRVIEAALLTDDRIQGIKDYTAQVSGSDLIATFTVVSIEGDLIYSTEVSL